MCRTSVLPSEPHLRFPEDLLDLLDLQTFNQKFLSVAKQGNPGGPGAS